MTVSDKTAICQLAYHIDEEQVQCMILQIYRLKSLSPSFLELLNEPRIHFVGVGVSGDFKQLERDFPNCTTCVQNILLSKRYINLGQYARKRNVVSNGQVSLQDLVNLTLKQTLSKDSSIRLSSKWSRLQLESEQIQYAALDAIKSLEVFNYLHQIPDITKRLTTSDITEDMAVTIAPSFGSQVCMSACGGYGTIVGYGMHLSPSNMKPDRMNTSESNRKVIVKIEKVNAPSFIIHTK